MSDPDAKTHLLLEQLHGKLDTLNGLVGDLVGMEREKLSHRQRMEEREAEHTAALQAREAEHAATLQRMSIEHGAALRRQVIGGVLAIMGAIATAIFGSVVAVEAGAFPMLTDTPSTYVEEGK